MRVQITILLICVAGCLGQDAEPAANIPTEAPAAAPEASVPETPAPPAAEVPAPETPAPPAAEAPAPETPAPPTAETPAPETPAPPTAETPAPPAAEAPAAEAVTSAAAEAAAPVTSANTTTTSTAAPPTPTPAPTPTPDKYFRVTQNNVTCVMFSGDIEFTVTYPKTSGKTGKVVVSVPRPANDTSNVSSSGSCLDNPQYINVSWGPTNTRSSFQLSFNSTGNKWELMSTEVELYLDETIFTNASDAGKTLMFFGQYPGISLVSVDTNSSFVCRASVVSSNFTTSIVNANSTAYSVTSSAVGFSVQAYNSIPNDKQLQQGSRCEADITSDLVPIAVGCALAGLVVLVLISYLVGRRRRSAAYQSV